MTSGRRHGITIVALLAMLASACGGGASPAPTSSSAAAATATPAPTAAACTPGRCEPPADILAKAKAEGELTVYTVLESSITTKIDQEMQEKYGIKVVTTKQNLPQLMQKVQSEADANKRVADIAPVSDTVAAKQWVQTGVISTFTTAQVPNAAVLKPDQILDNAAYFFGGAVYALGFNTSKVPGGVAPKSYCELTDPKWKGLVAITFAVGTTVFKHYDMIEKACGAGYFEKLVANGVKFYPGTANAMQALAAGEYAASIATIPYILAPFKEKGAPVDFILPADGISVSVRYGAVVKNAPHPNAALVYTNYLLSVEAQKLMYTGAYLGYSVLPASVLPGTLQTTVPVTYADAANAKEVEARITKSLGR